MPVRPRVHVLLVRESGAMNHGDTTGLPYATAGPSLPGVTGISAFSPRRLSLPLS
jgi:hypothetical protein